jgi:molybdenum cofactor guanylyltransferase
VLAGGGSTRFGRDKALAEIGGKAMLARMCELIADVVSPDVRIIGPASKYGQFGMPCAEDRWPGEGPLGGIVTALLEASRSAKRPVWNLVVSCDMPFLARPWLRYLTEHAAESAADVIVPRSSSGLEPLCAYWRTSCAGQLQRIFEQGVRKISDATKQLHVEVLDEKHWERFDSAGRLFWNMNTLADYEEAKRILEAERA